MTVPKLIDIAGGQYVPTTCLVTSSGTPYTASGGSGGGTLSDTILTDDSGTQFLARDDGTELTFITLAGAPYTPTTNVRAIQIAGGATAANQATEITSLGTIATNTGTTATNTSTTNTNLGTINTSISTGNTSLATIASNTTLGGNATGSITTQNLVPAGTATAGSAVEITLNGASAMAIQITGTYTGALSLQLTVDGTNWITSGASCLTSIGSNVIASSISSATQGIYYAEVGSALKARITGLAAMTGTATVTLRSSISASFVSVGNLANLATLAGGQTNHSAASTGAPVRVAGRVNTAVDTTLVQGDASDLFMTSSGAQIVKAYAAPEVDWTYAAASGGIVNTSDNVLVAAQAAGIRNYCTGISLQNASATVASEVVIKDGSTVIWRGYVGTTATVNNVVNVVFPTPLRSSAAAALNFAVITTGSQVYTSAQGYAAP